ncbi:hypothetical protein [Cohnella thailandensis]|uniref:Uncharacterized protein n=1 Tax=Cohnella thailandensis TaxID=557557 RepID=A0A841T8A4_9BACL|nr:hypothetical protein [Cohnella thailandensis]MBB6638290.1 hypothetical protein [Cohnella thailandensis]MBP1977231.1 hypothetical protein [Cohnella thailandensis]
MDYSHLQEWFEKERELNEFEIEILTLLLSKPFKGRNILKEQIVKTKVNGRCKCGCLSINLTVPHDINKFPHHIRVPVEINVKERNEPVMILLHVVDGYINELEILRADSEPIIEKLDITNYELIIRRELEEESNST